MPSLPFPLFLSFHRMAQGEHPLERLGLWSPKKPLDGGVDISIRGDKGLQVCITVSKTQGLQLLQFLLVATFSEEGRGQHSVVRLRTGVGQGMEELKKGQGGLCDIFSMGLSSTPSFWGSSNPTWFS